MLVKGFHFAPHRPELLFASDAHHPDPTKCCCDSPVPKALHLWFRQLADSVLRHDHGQVTALLSSSAATPGAKSLVNDPNALLVDPPGYTLLHLACVFNKHRCVAALLHHPSSQSAVNLPDAASLWTPLHHALYAGNLRAAAHLLLHPQIHLHAMDCDGRTPLRLLHHDTLPPLPLTPPTDLFTWGNNANFVLGHGHAFDSSSSTSSSSANAGDPQPKRASFRPHDDLATFLYTQDFAGMPTITQLSVAKYHACMLTHDPTRNQTQLYMWGYASGGRLGSSRAASAAAVTKPTPVTFDGAPEFTAVAAAHNHSLAITALGTVWVWGSNHFGQCGLSLDTHTVAALAKGYPKAFATGGGPRQAAPAGATDDLVVDPRPLTTGHLKREPMTHGGVAASKIHSCVWTAHTLVTFGLNVGQLGHGRDSIVVQPRKVASLPTDAAIVHVACTERFTLVVLDSGAAFVLQDFTTRRLKLSPLPSIRESHLGKAAGWSQAAPARLPAIARACAQDSLGVSYGAVVTVQGHVYAWSVTGTASPPAPGTFGAGDTAMDAFADSAGKRHAKTAALKWTPPKCVWPQGRDAGRAVDVAVGLEGALEAQEEAKRKLRRTQLPSPAPGQSSTPIAPAPPLAAVGTTPPVPIRLAKVPQKERKRLNKAGAEPHAPVQSAAPWASPTPVSLAAPAIAPAASGGSAAAPWSKPDTRSSAASSSWPSLALATAPSASPAASSSSSSSFAAIQKEQLQAKSTKYNQVKKALAEIQIEEAAMAEIMVRFRDKRGPALISGEMMSVVVLPR